jgi:hypothetical protein
MDEFKRLKSDDDTYSYGYYKIHQLSNNQVIGIFFIKNKLSRNIEYHIALSISNKKKHLFQYIKEEKDVLSGKETGKCGLEGLLWAKKQIIEFENSICKPGNIICVRWSDNRRRKVYEYGLKKIGYKIGFRDGSKCLYKIINKGDNK